MDLIDNLCIWLVLLLGVHFITVRVPLESNPQPLRNPPTINALPMEYHIDDIFSMQTLEAS